MSLARDARPRDRPAPGLACSLAARRGAVPCRLPGRAQHRRCGRDRRRLRKRGRSGPNQRRRADLRRFPRRCLPGRHLRPGQLPRLRALRADLALERQLGRASGRARRGGVLRPGDVRAPALARPAAAPRPRGPDDGSDARLRLGGVSVHDVRPAGELQRHPRRPPARAHTPPHRPPGCPWSANGIGDPDEVRPAPPRSDAADVSPGVGGARKHGSEEKDGQGRGVSRG